MTVKKLKVKRPVASPSAAHMLVRPDADEQKIAEGFDDDTADCKLISSDNVVFRMHSYNICAHR
jgi:hypothetical protein